MTALVVIWGFAATLTIQGGLELLRIQTIYNDVVIPTRDLLAELQNERLMSATYLGTNTTLHTELDAQRHRTDSATDNLIRVSRQARDDTPGPMWDRLQELIRQMGKIQDLRRQVDDRGLSRLNAIERYSDLAEVGFQTYDRLMISPNLDLVEQTKAIILITRSREIVSQQSALITGALAAGRMTRSEHDAFSAMVGKRRLLYQLGTSLLDAELIKPYERLSATPSYTSFVAMEDSIVTQVQPDRPLPASAAPWHRTAEMWIINLAGVNASKTIADRAMPLAKGVLFRIGIAGVLGLIAVAATALISLRFARSLTAELVELQRAALELADRRLPAIVDRLRRGEDVDVAAETPPMLSGGDTAEVENVGNAFTSVQHTAIEAAVGQAELRKGVNSVFLNLARRSQSLLQRQLSMLDGLERQVTDPDVLEQLFGIDHLTTRMRRHAEGLITLSGAAPGRGWRNPVSLFDVVRAAVEEVEDYLRVSVDVAHGPALVGGAVTDLVHLLAELVENATIYSPPHTQIFVHGELVARGFALEIEDRGLGIAAEEMAQFNERLADPPEFNLADSDRLGLFVVGLLAKRHGIRVSLRTSPYGGTSAIVLLPQELVVENAAGDYSVESLVPPQPTPPPALTLTPLPEDIPAVPVAQVAEPLEAAELATLAGLPDLTGPTGGMTGIADIADIGDIPDIDAEDSLPRRVRQANLAPQLREERRDVFSSFQAGWQRAQEES
ncbi:nitrate- and nitrite sensing domain-containing protein [Planotetraspora sp. A-T 1434]|uniref:sensor histidine kinase n=1 Tax=Planotetraspora sp. A-T 1434 TaxID=2979219 RepID=UPI0021BF4717|nr:nitrate- and nitrite sensing domain-containing protein [Planotetraspora sp. A-T 1434]MCT9931999.1 nitrate- and nitrite sensing domain-containing protein [Planotetraspora sp. A-T 1434]